MWWYFLSGPGWVARSRRQGVIQQGGRAERKRWPSSSGWRKWSGDRSAEPGCVSRRPGGFCFDCFGQNEWNPLRESFKRPLQTDWECTGNLGVWLKLKKKINKNKSGLALICIFFPSCKSNLKVKSSTLCANKNVQLFYVKSFPQNVYSLWKIHFCPIVSKMWLFSVFLTWIHIVQHPAV